MIFLSRWREPGRAGTGRSASANKSNGKRHSAVRNIATCNKTRFHCGPSNRCRLLCAILECDSDPAVRRVVGLLKEWDGEFDDKLGCSDSVQRVFCGMVREGGCGAIPGNGRGVFDRRDRGRWRPSCFVPIAPVGSENATAGQTAAAADPHHISRRDRAAQEAIRRRSGSLDVGTPASARSQARPGLSRRTRRAAQSRGAGVRGDGTTVCNTGRGPEFEAATGAGYRMICDLGESPAGLWAVDCQSQSGHPGSPHYSDQYHDWLGGKVPLCAPRSQRIGKRDFRQPTLGTAVIKPPPRLCSIRGLGRQTCRSPESTSR